MNLLTICYFYLFYTIILGPNWAMGRFLSLGGVDGELGVSEEPGQGPENLIVPYNNICEIALIMILYVYVIMILSICGILENNKVICHMFS